MHHYDPPQDVDHANFVRDRPNITEYKYKPIAGTDFFEMTAIVKNGDEEREYRLPGLLDYCLYHYIRKMQEVDNLRLKISIAYEAKTILNHLITGFEIAKSKLTFEKVRDYDYSKITYQLECTIESYRLQLELDRYELEERKLRQETKKI